MKVSVIIPVYNVSKYIEKSINSICNQTMQNDVECIIVNDRTPDNSIEKAKHVIANYKGPIKFKIIEHEQNKGLAAARSTGMKNAQGDYVLHLDSDDYYENNMIEELYQNAIQNNSDVSICDFFQTYIDKESIYSVKEINNPEEYVKSLIRHNYNDSVWNVWNKMFKRELFYKNGIDWVEGINFGEDNLICAKLFCFIKKVSKVNKPLYHYTHYNTSSYTNTLDTIVDEKTIPVLTNIEKFLRDKHLYSKFETDINFRKLSIKIILLRFGEKELRKYYNTLYPNTYKYIWKSPDISPLSKIKLYLAHININLFNVFETIHKQILKYENV